MFFFLLLGVLVPLHYYNKIPEAQYFKRKKKLSCNEDLKESKEEYNKTPKELIKTVSLNGLRGT